MMKLQSLGRLIGTGAALLLFTACRPTTAPTGSAPTPSAAADAASPAAVKLPVTDVAGLEALLAARGVKASFETEQDLGYLGVPGRIYSLGGDETLEVHAYPDAAAAERMAAGVAPDGGSVKDAAGERVAVVWLGTPHFFHSGPLIAVYVGDTPATLGTLVEALGPPFAGSAAGKK